MPVLSVEGKKYRLGDVTGQPPLWTVPVDGRNVFLEVLREVESNPPVLLVRAGSRVIRVSAQQTNDPNTYSVEVDGSPVSVRIESDTSEAEAMESVIGPLVVTSPMAGKIAALKAQIGATVDAGQVLVVLEAMKMENDIASPKKGIVKEIYVEQGALAKPGDKLVLVE